MENLWNKDIINKKEPTPKEILATQANFLEEMTNSKLVPSIRTVTAHPFIEHDAVDFSNECFVHSFYIKVPALDYSFTLLRLVHETMSVKPFQVYSNLTEKKYNGENIGELEKILKDVFSAKEVNEALTNLIAQASE